ncbi:uncharacterized protein K489DRAFT_233678 [Dissoconium aciculare CBS 342.82]|uniref:Uncharacterized protein n=1 Tax=Dissoconium aciculare CBS 342.82 TaxID=1314786 RepID=A0A6J3M2K5_9PEZI|nr:uncharacterized protein K489DRAFT_233678 [Dissoconium aciculare CBS 342.82]KAF1822133.1 hypothetical protein K489DRAFT_233678 [Dissoconium aciculare CBS 342.82]
MGDSHGIFPQSRSRSTAVGAWEANLMSQVACKDGKSEVWWPSVVDGHQWERARSSPGSGRSDLCSERKHRSAADSAPPAWVRASLPTARFSVLVRHLFSSKDEVPWGFTNRNLVFSSRNPSLWGSKDREREGSAPAYVSRPERRTLLHGSAHSHADQ